MGILRRPILILGLALVLVIGACGSDDDKGGAPVFDPPISDKTAYVNTDFELRMFARDPEGDPINFGLASEIKDIGGRSTMEQVPPNGAVFRWTPIAADVGIRAFTFVASDGANDTAANITIDVRPGAGAVNAPIFRKPLGTGTTLDLSQKKCLEVEVVVEDSDTPEVEIAQEDPPIPGAILKQRSGLSASWEWCPTPDQVETNERYVLTLSADDGENPKATKNFLIVLRREFKPDCPGEAPVITHTPGDVSSVLDLTIDATVSDDKGIRYEPLLYYSTDPPADPPDLSAMSQVTMLLIDGDMTSGTWAADVPNPVASQPPDSSATLYYLMAAQDNDDEEGDCDHLTEAPETGTFKITVTNPGGSGGLGLCEPCSTDTQCGGDGDNCLFMGEFADDYFCFRGCQGDNDCPEPGYYCSQIEFQSIDGVSARQCIPDTYECTAASNCADDGFEPNDTRDDAVIMPGLETGSYPALKSCPGSVLGSDDDWYPIDIFDQSDVTISLQGGSETNLDLALLDWDGNVMEKSESPGSSESIQTCLEYGSYFIRVASPEKGENTYTLDYNRTAGCVGVCEDDGDEDDDDGAQARDVALPGPWRSTTNAICAGDEDWFEVDLTSGQTLYVVLTFDMASAREDLDLHLYQYSTLLTVCTEQDTSGCDPDNGQSGTSNESMTTSITTNGVYYVVVHGWDNSENLYDICISTQSGACP